MSKPDAGHMRHVVPRLRSTATSLCICVSGCARRSGSALFTVSVIRVLSVSCCWCLALVFQFLRSEDAWHTASPLKGATACFSPQFPDYLPCSVMLQPAPQDTGKVGSPGHVLGSFLPSEGFRKRSFITGFRTQIERQPNEPVAGLQLVLTVSDPVNKMLESPPPGGSHRSMERNRQEADHEHLRAPPRVLGALQSKRP